MEGKSDLHRLLEDRTVDLALKIKRAAANDLEYWDGEKNPPNLPRKSFEIFLDYLEEGDVQNYSIDSRTSRKGKYGKTGLPWIFKFEHTTQILSVKKRYFCKGFFFEKSDLRGLEIQSFREVQMTLKIID
ncbi:MAG: hypothetical protein HQK49_12675 [Oligoflexia bacterium]|nr:hypothetical protein [Oligoflexia bacterium]